MTRPPMLPETAADDLEHLDDFEVGDVYKTARHALETLAAMRVEECGRVLTMEETGGRHKVRTTYRLVGEWVDRNE